MKWGDELCGVPVTPESWTGGIVQNGEGAWVEVLPVHKGMIEIQIEVTGGNDQTPVPIFPPRNFAGKTDAELWCEVATNGGQYLYASEIGDGNAPFYIEWQAQYNWAKPELMSRDIFYPYPEGAVTDLHIDRIGDYITALQNAHTLAQRLQQRDASGPGEGGSE